MSEERWSDIEALFAEAAEIAPTERRALLDARCAKTPGIRSEVESLLASHDRAGEFLQIPVPAPSGAGNPLAAVEAATPFDPSAGELVGGRYRLLEQVGAGGMGIVYRAARADGEYEEQVAVKLLAAPMHSAEAIRRFRVERQVLARLNHPDIVTLLDGGVTSTGQAYLAMRLVSGVPIAEFCGARRLDLPERIRLFQRVCGAVHHAHQNGVVHRDLKPANILVTADGAPKVLDFGVAKLLDPEGQASATVTTVYGPITPNYASPEQLRGLPVTTACDVYALGVLLYELLAGARPYETAGQPLEQLLATVVEHDPARPSVAASTARIPYHPRRLTGDLDAIVRKAMSKEPERRYASAQELSEDLGRHLAGQPVLARDPSLLYVAGRLARRHRTGVIAGAVTAIALMLGLGIAIRETRIATTERNRATKRFDDVRQLANALIFKIDEAVRPLAGSTPVRQTIVAEALRYLERLSEDDAGDDPGLRLELARAYHRIGSIQGDPSTPNLGDRQGAMQSLTRAITLLQPVGGAQARDADLERAEAQLTFARVNSADPTAAETAMSDALGIATMILDRDPTDVAARRLLGAAHFAFGQRGEREARVDHLTRASAVFEALALDDPSDEVRQRNVGLAQKYLGDLYLSAGSYEVALTHHQRALTIDEERLAASPGDRRRRFDVAIDLANVGFCQWGLGRFGDSAASYERGREMFASLSDSDPEDVAASYWRARAHTRLARVYHDAGNQARSLEQAREAVRRLAPLKNVDAVYQARYGEALVALGRSHLAVRRRKEGCARLAEAVRILNELTATNRGHLMRPDEAAHARTLLASCPATPAQ